MLQDLINFASVYNGPGLTASRYFFCLELYFEEILNTILDSESRSPTDYLYVLCLFWLGEKM